MNGIRAKPGLNSKQYPADLSGCAFRAGYFCRGGQHHKNEILSRLRIHPESLTGKIPAIKINRLIYETDIYSFQFLEWKRKFELKNTGLRLQ